ncbi:unnamed protein product [Durusdinium trenchii]|uniref:Uncharacterized protein n=1 Tax=Durusdinium trenchii TaxID=1381693 RepID=A0ABP0K6D3_9DINO
MEGMFEKDVEQRLGIVYAERQLALEAKSNWDEANALMWNYVAAFISGVPVENLTEGDVTRAARQFTFRFPRHVEAQALLFEIAHEVVGPRASDAVYDFALLQKILSKFGQRLGALEDNECQVMKNKLTSLEYHSGNGLVRLGDFYGDQEHFTEGADYLRSSGVLDESDPEDPKVIIPNYLASPSNCVQPAGGSVCCFDECEALMDQVEKNLEAPMGSLELAKFCGLGPCFCLPAGQPHAVSSTLAASGRRGWPSWWNGATPWPSLCSMDARSLSTGVQLPSHCPAYQPRK